MNASSFPTSLVAAASLLAGFGVAELTGVRAIGGLVLLAGGAWCALRWRERAGGATAAGLVGVCLVLFVLSHVLGHAIGAWPAVFMVAAVAALAAHFLADARPARLRA